MSPVTIAMFGVLLWCIVFYLWRIAVYLAAINRNYCKVETARAERELAARERKASKDA